MKIKVTEIEANARELRECNSLAGNVYSLLSRVFQSNEPFEEEEESEDNDDI